MSRKPMHFTDWVVCAVPGEWYRSKQGLGAQNHLPNRQNLSLFYCAMALGEFRLCKLQGAQIRGLVQPFAGFQSLVLLSCSVHVPGSV